MTRLRSNPSLSPIDFIAPKSDRRIYIQVAYLLATEETTSRAFGALGGARANRVAGIGAGKQFADRLEESAQNVQKQQKLFA